MGLGLRLLKPGTRQSRTKPKHQYVISLRQPHRMESPGALSRPFSCTSGRVDVTSCRGISAGEYGSEPVLLVPTRCSSCVSQDEDELSTDAVDTCRNYIHRNSGGVSCVRSRVRAACANTGVRSARAYVWLIAEPYAPDGEPGGAVVSASREKVGVVRRTHRIASRIGCSSRIPTGDRRRHPEGRRSLHA